MIDFLVGVDGGGTGTRARLAHLDGTEIAQGRSGPSGLAHGVARAWAAVDEAIADAFAAAAIPRPPRAAIGVGLGIAGAHNRQWAADFAAADPGYGALVADTDAMSTLLGAFGGGPGAILAVGTGSVGLALFPDGRQREVGGWGFPSGDEGSGAWIGLRAVNHGQQMMDGRKRSTDFGRAVLDACGGSRDGLYAWLARANQTGYASLAPLVVSHAATDEAARNILVEAGRQIEAMAQALDPSAEMPFALCGGLCAPLRPYLPSRLAARSVAPRGDSASGALRMIERHVKRG